MSGAGILVTVPLRSAGVELWHGSSFAAAQTLLAEQPARQVRPGAACIALAADTGCCQAGRQARGLLCKGTRLAKQLMLQGDQGEPREDKVVLSTIHRAKGLEWDAVFVMRCMQDHLPMPYWPPDGAWPLPHPPIDSPFLLAQHSVGAAFLLVFRLLCACFVPPSSVFHLWPAAWPRALV